GGHLHEDGSARATRRSVGGPQPRLRVIRSLPPPVLAEKPTCLHTAEYGAAEDFVRKLDRGEKAKVMGMGLAENDLLSTEEALAYKLANLWVKPSQHGLSRFTFDKYLGDNEALGGRAYLTSYRILFKPHGRNRLVGMSSVFLPNVVQ